MWEEIIGIAKGEQTVHEAVLKIVDCVPKVLDNVDSQTRGWFMLSTLH